MLVGILKKARPEAGGLFIVTTIMQCFNDLSVVCFRRNLSIPGLHVFWAPYLFLFCPDVGSRCILLLLRTCIVQTQDPPLVDCKRSWHEPSWL